MRTTAAVIALATVLLARPMRAQQLPLPADTSLHVLTTGEGKTLLCRTLPDLAAERAHLVLREFRIGAQLAPIVDMSPRELQLAFDSAGTPLAISDEVTVVPVRAESVNMVLTRDGTLVFGKRSAAPFDSATVARLESGFRNRDIAEVQAATPKPVFRDVTADEVRQAKEMAQWFWAHRCDR